MATNRVPKAEIVPGLLLATTRYPEVLIVSGPNSRGMVRAEVAGRGVLSFPWQVFRWQ